MIKTGSDITGYDLIQEINDKFKDLWKASAGTIYPLLNRLEEKGLLESEEITEDGRQKKVYRITGVGKQKLKTILENNLGESLNTLGDYIKTVVKASIPDDRFFNEVFSCFPFRAPIKPEPIDKSDYSLENIRHIEHLISEVKEHEKRVKRQIEFIENQIREYEQIKQMLISERDKNAKIIEIVDDEEEFEKF